MRVCMVTPHLPPEQSANALLPVMIGDALLRRGVRAAYVSHPPADSARHAADREVTYVPRRGRGRFDRSKAGAVAAGVRMIAGAAGAIRSSDLVHLHGNGFIVEVGQWLSRRHHKPYVLTLYGTDISAHDPVRHARFGSVVRGAVCRVFYSRGLLEQARALGLAPDSSGVIYAPVGSAFRPGTETERTTVRRDLGAEDGPVLLTVKRLHPLGGHDALLNAMPSILARFPAAMLWLAGDGESRAPLEAQCRDLGIAPHVRFLGRIENEALAKYYIAADLFVLASRVESWGTVMLESLACGTPVVTTETVGGREVSAMFPEDVSTVKIGDADRLADGVIRTLSRCARVSRTASDRLLSEFSVDACASKYLAVYEQAVGSRYAPVR